MPHRLPTAHEREAIFSWLKQASSMTAWERVFAFHEAFVDVVEKAFEDTQRHPLNDEPPYIPASWVSMLLKDHAAFRVALTRLRGGDRRCFCFLGASGHFNQGISALEFWDTMYHRNVLMGEGDYPAMRSPFWPQIHRTMQVCWDVYCQVGVVLQPRHTDVPASPDSADGLYEQDDYFPIRILLAQPTLPPVPSPVEPPVVVKTGKDIPSFGIWEPVKKVGSQYELDGCMSYLHANSPAPTIDFPEDGQRHEGRPTLWRLIWADDRYVDKPVPDEEKDYVVARAPPPDVKFD